MSSPHFILDLRTKDGQEVCKVLLPPIPAGLSTDQAVELIKKFWPRGCELADGKTIRDFAEEISNCPASGRTMVAGAVYGGADQELRDSNDTNRRLSGQVDALEKQLPKDREQRKTIADKERQLTTQGQELARAKADNERKREEAERLRKSLKDLTAGLHLLMNEEGAAVPRTELRRLIEEAEEK